MISFYMHYKVFACNNTCFKSPLRTALSCAWMDNEVTTAFHAARKNNMLSFK